MSWECIGFDRNESGEVCVLWECPVCGKQYYGDLSDPPECNHKTGVTGMVKESLPVSEILAGLAEESSELAQAALKLRRVFDGTNPTPTSEDSAIEALHEEIADVQLYISMLDVNQKYISVIMKRKLQRWEERLISRKEGRG